MRLAVQQVRDARRGLCSSRHELTALSQLMVDLAVANCERAIGRYACGTLAKRTHGNASVVECCTWVATPVTPYQIVTLDVLQNFNESQKA